jgi:hypothetical protein
MDSKDSMSDDSDNDNMKSKKKSNGVTDSSYSLNQ